MITLGEPVAVSAPILPAAATGGPWPPPGLLQAARAFIHSLASLVPAGPQAVLDAAAPFLARLAGTTEAAFVVPSRSSWRVAAGAAPTGGLARRAHKLGPPSRGWDRLVPIESLGLTFIPLRPGALALVVPCELDPDAIPTAALLLCAQACEVVVANAEHARDAADARAEAASLERVAGDILSIGDVHEVLLSIAHTAMSLLGGDMGGVLLVEGESLVMRALMGNRSVQTARLRMAVGQGVAGRVLETGEPVKVDSYLKSEAISHDFDALARLEDTRSALGAPLIVHGQAIGVLEVWRRRPSLFNNADVRRLAALANLAAIAIENARLYDLQEASVRELAIAREGLSGQLQVLEKAGALQRELVRLVLDGEGLPAIARASSARLGGVVAVFSETFDQMVGHPKCPELEALARELRRAVAAGPISGEPFLVDDGWLTVQQIRAGDEALGWFCFLSEAVPDTTVKLGVGEAALSCALSRLEHRAAEHALAQDREELLWDLLDGTADHRQGAVSRARRRHIDLASPQRALVGVIDHLDEAVRAEGWDSTQVERFARETLSMAQRVLSSHGAGDLVSFRRDTLVALVPLAEAAPVRELVAALGAEVRRILPGAALCWGVSRAHAQATDFGPAGHEAHTAVRAARRLGAGHLALYDELGVVRLLLASDGEADLGPFVDDVLGPVLEHDRKHAGVLTQTLRAYFLADCSQQAAARVLFVHHKTLRYRLARIEALTRLDLNRHEDRLRADLALRIHEVMERSAVQP